MRDRDRDGDREWGVCVCMRVKKLERGSCGPERERWLTRETLPDVREELQLSGSWGSKMGPSRK